MLQSSSIPTIYWKKTSSSQIKTCQNWFCHTRDDTTGLDAGVTVKVPKPLWRPVPQLGQRPCGIGASQGRGENTHRVSGAWGSHSRCWWHGFVPTCLTEQSLDNSDIPLHTLFHAAQKGWQYQHELLRDASVSLDALVDAIGNYPNIYGTHLQT